MIKPPLRWGILGAAQIARKNWKAILNSGNGVLSGVGSRDRDKSSQFIADCQSSAAFEVTPRAMGSYEEVIQAADIDAVYIPLPTGVRKEWVLRAAKAGKHVLCEKPCATSASDLAEMTGACARNNVQFMDGVMFMHSRRLDRIRDVLNDGVTVGPIRRIESTFNFNAPDEFFKSNIRVQSQLEPFGCLGDLGWYCIRFALWTMDWEMPWRTSGRVLSSAGRRSSAVPVPVEFSGELFFGQGITCSFYCSFKTGLQQTATISGELGHVHLSDFVLPFNGGTATFDTFGPTQTVRGCDFTVDPHHRRWTVEEWSHSQPNAQESNMFRAFAEQALSGKLNSAWPAISLKTQQTMEACLEAARGAD
jgi:predicted dehydrogenase